MARFSGLQDAALTALEEAVSKFEEDLEVLRHFTAKLDALDAADRKAASRLVPMLKDPENIPALEKEFQALEKQAGGRVQQFLELFEKWKAEGFRVERLEKALSADQAAMRSAFLQFDEDVRRLRGLSERASRLDVSFATQVAGLNRGLHDPEQLHKMELAVRELEEESERKKPAAARKAHAPPPKVVHPARTAPAPAAPKEPAGEGAPGAPRSPAVELAPEPPKAAAAAPAAGSPETELAAEIAAAEAAIKELEARKIDPAAASNLLKLGKSFNRSKNHAKALQYARKAKETAEAMKK